MQCKIKPTIRMDFNYSFYYVVFSANNIYTILAALESVLVEVSNKFQGLSSGNCSFSRALKALNFDFEIQGLSRTSI